MHDPDRPRLLGPGLSCGALAAWYFIFATFGLTPLSGPAVLAQEIESRTLRLGGFTPGGARASITDGWSTFDFEVTNLSDQDRRARVEAFFAVEPGVEPDVQYSRDIWVPARSTITSWMLVGPPTGEHPSNSCEIEIHLYDSTDGTERLIRPLNEKRLLTRKVLYRKREPFTAILLDEEEVPKEPAFGDLPRPETRADEAVRFARTARAVNALSEFVNRVPSGPLPVNSEAYDTIDQFVVASARLAHDPAGLQALREWLQRGGTVWIMLDMIEPDEIAAVLGPLLGSACDFQVVDRVGLTSTKIEAQAAGQRDPKAVEQEHERPVEFVRVLLPPEERGAHTVNGWPAWITRRVGKGKVLLSMAGPRAWMRPRASGDQRSPYPNYPSLPVAIPPLEAFARELYAPPAEDRFGFDAFKPMLTDDIGYSIVSRQSVLLIFGGSLLAALLCGIALRKSRRPERMGWACPAAALVAAAAFFVLGESSRRSTPPTVAVAQIVDADTCTAEAPVRGLLAVYRPDSGTVEAGVFHGGRFDLDMEGTEGQTHSFMVTDVDSWRWDNLSMPAGVRFAPFHGMVSTGEPIKAVARLGPEGVEGKLAAGVFQDLDDAILSTPNGRKLAVRLRADGTFSAGVSDLLPPGQFLAGAVLSDRQQRRRDVYREFLKRPASVRPDRRNLLMVWAKPLDMHFSLVANARTVGGALLVVPLRLERPTPGERVMIPGPLIPYSQIVDSGPIRATVESSANVDMHLRFQLPTAVLPFRVESASLVAKVNAPLRQVAIAGRVDGRLVELRRETSPLDPMRVDIAKELLNLDDQGGLHLNLAISDTPPQGGTGAAESLVDERWAIEYLELEVSGHAE